MKLSLSSIFKLLIGFSCCVLSIAYASIVDDFSINGDIEAGVQKGVFIYDTICEDDKIVVNSYTSSIITSIVTLDKSSDSKAKIEIVVFNNSDKDYGFSATKYTKSSEDDDINYAYSNEDIAFSVDLVRRDSVVKSQSSLSFNVEFYYKDGVVDNNVLQSIVFFEFLPLEEIPDDGEIAISGALNQFENVLNENTSYTELIDQMKDNNENNRSDDSYIGNVVGASEADQALLNKLFEGNLFININGVDTSVKVLIKKENVGGSSAEEMTIYMTTDDLSKGSNSYNTYYAQVYASIFEYDNGDWVQIGDIVEGKAPIVNYNGHWDGTGGSFTTDNWVSVSTTSALNNKKIGEIYNYFKQ